MIGFVVCLNCFFSGASCKRMALCIQPEITLLNRKVCEHGKKNKKPSLVVYSKLHDLFDCLVRIESKITIYDGLDIEDEEIDTIIADIAQEIVKAKKILRTVPSDD